MLNTMVLIYCCLPAVCVVHSLFLSSAFCPFRSSHVCHVHYTRPMMMVIVDDDRFYMAGDDVDVDDDNVVVDVYNGTDGDDD